MPKYAFHIASRSEVTDQEWEFPDISVARSNAVKYASELMADAGTELFDDDLRVNVSDEKGLLLFSIVVLATEAPAVRLRSVSVG